MIGTLSGRRGGRHRLSAGAAIAIVAILSGPAGRVVACPFCFGSLQLSLREQIEASESTVIVRWISGEPGNLEREVPASTTFEVVENLRGDPGADGGGRFQIDRHQTGTRGDLFLISAARLEGELKWDRAIPLSQTALAYLRGLPPADASATDKLRYAVRYLESDDDTVATDAFSVLGSARYEDIAVVADEFPREELRRWVFEGQKLKGQLGVYGMLIGLCGEASDADRLAGMILNVGGPDDFRLGIAGVMGGYLLLAGPEGLELLEREFLANAAASASDRAAVMEALRFIGQYAVERIPRERLARALRENLETIGYPELAIADLARWQDWSSTPALVTMYDDPRQTDKYVKRAILQFMILASQAEREGRSDEERASLESAARFVERVQQEDPASFRRAERALVPMSMTVRPCSISLPFRTR